MDVVGFPVDSFTAKFILYYDFMGVFVDRSNFQYCSMDTDSVYMALSATSLDEMIKPDMQQRFQMEKKNWFPRGYQWNGNLC
jgi:prenyltransferase beta subunit